MFDSNKKSAVDRHLDLLGLGVRDKVSGFKGVVSSVSFELYGCVQAVVSPPTMIDGNTPNCKWFDVTRLEIVDDTPVMKLPDFDKGYVAEGKKGAAVKPLP